MARQFDQEKKSAIMNAALILITNNGFEATPMSAIAREAGVAAGTIYVYFPSKQEPDKTSLPRTQRSCLQFLYKGSGCHASG